jgi:hypothetical protein
MPIKIDLVTELQTALTDPDVRAVLSAYIKQAVKEALAERDTDSWLDQKGAATLLGLTIPSFTGKRRRYPELDQMSAGNWYGCGAGVARTLERWLRQQSPTGKTETESAAVFLFRK